MRIFKPHIFFLSISVLFTANAQSAECVRSVKELNSAKVNTVWEETTMDDGKPLVITISDGPSKLVYTAIKAGEVWLNGEVCISRDGRSMTLKNTKATRNVPWIARQALPSSQSGKIENSQVHLGGIAWSGTFVAKKSGNDKSENVRQE